MHARVHDEDLVELRGDTLVVRNLRVKSDRLHISGNCDAVEFHQSMDGNTLPGRDGKWKVYPIEYKRGVPKLNHEDELQLCAEAICLEEMLLCSISEGALYYGETRHREKVALNDSLRDEVEQDYQEMFQLFQRGYTPVIKRTRSCNACSLKNICLPELEKKENVQAYLKNASEE